MKRKLLLLALLAMLVAPAAAMATQVIEFYDTKTSSWIDVASWDWDPGTALADNALPLSNIASSFNLYYQAVLTNFKAADNSLITTTGLNTDYQITMVAGFGESGSTIFANATTATAMFNLDPSASVNYFSLYIDFTADAGYTAANALAGTGYTDGTQLMTGVIDSSTGNITVFFKQISLLDQFGADNWAGQKTVAAQGSAVISAIVQDTDVNSSYVKIPTSWTDFILELAFNSSTVTPFQQADPSHVVAGVTANIGTVNGLNGQDFIFQADGNSSFDYSPVPEPSTMVLLGVGIIGLGVIGRKRR